jgi:hypothetical protein
MIIRRRQRTTERGPRGACVLGLGDLQRLRRWLVVFCVSVGVWTLCCTSAQALVARGHAFGFSFGGVGAGAGQLSGPAGVAVSKASGDVYVVDSGNDRIERFDAKGEFIAVWGWGVKDGKQEFEVCERGCQAGIPGAGKGQVDLPEAIAVDNSTSASDPSRGDLYVVADGRLGHAHLEKFTAGGEPLGSIKQAGVEAKWEGALDGVAVDNSGRLRFRRRRCGRARKKRARCSGRPGR